MIYYKVKIEDDKIKILDVIDSSIKPRDGAGIMFLNLEEMNRFNPKLVEFEYTSGIEKYL